MIVIVIIGTIYTLAVSKLQTISTQSQTPSLTNLKEYLHSFLKEDAKNARLLCLDDCSECSLYIDGLKEKSVESFLDSTVEVYRYDFLQGVVAIEPKFFFNEDSVEERVCFSFEIDKNFISDQVLILYKNRAYDYTKYFTKRVVYNSLDEIVDAKETDIQEVFR